MNNIFTKLRSWSTARLFNVPRNDTLVCRSVETLPVLVGPDGLELPGLVSRGQTAFLALEVEAMPARSGNPFVDVQHGQTSYRQYFERRAAGRRHLNLSPVFQEHAGALGKIRLGGSALRWHAGGSLALFDPFPIEAPILVLAPHPDDAEIAAFGLYASSPSWVVTITAGEGGSAELSEVVPEKDDQIRWRASLRVWDSLTIPQQGNVPRERSLNLVYPDRQLETMHASGRPLELACEPTLSRASLRARNLAPQFCAGGRECTWSELVAELRLLLETARPAVVVSPHPVIDEHRDHVFTTVALEEAMRTSAHRVSAVLLYVVHVRGAHVHPVGPAAGVVSLPPWTDDWWIADSLYSHPVPAELRRAKYFAVDSSHDERSYGSGNSRTLQQILSVARRETAAFITGAPPRPTSFLRRAPRPNELFYVVSPDGLSALVDRATGRGGVDKAGSVKQIDPAAR